MSIVGDYDCDGVLSTAILEATLSRLGAQPTVYLPHRDEGYGLRNEVVHRFSTHGTGLLITIDNGINAAGPVRLAQRLGIGVVIVDHHHIETRAEATAVWSEHFCAAGTTVLLSWALLETAGASEIDCFLAGLSRLAAIASTRFLCQRLECLRSARVCNPDFDVFAGEDVCKRGSDLAGTNYGVLHCDAPFSQRMLSVDSSGFNGAGLQQQRNTGAGMTR